MDGQILMDGPEYDALRPYCATRRQAEILEAIITEGSIRKGGRALGIARQNVCEALKRIRKNAARRGLAPEHDMKRPVPDGFHVKGVSTYYDDDGKVRGQWVKSNRDLEDVREAVRAYVDELAVDIKPRKRSKAPKVTHSDLLVAYPIGDHHFGLYARAGLAGGEYNLDIAKKVLADAVDYLVDSSPAAETALLVNLGDFTHSDDSTNATRKNKHVLDVAGYYLETCRAASFALAYAVERLLAKHKFVRIMNCPGNHDADTSGWLSIALEAYFRNEPRVTIDDSGASFQFYQFGANMICATHGHKTKLENLPGIMANLEPKIWGDTKYRVAYTGHMHHGARLAAKEHHGATVEQFGILAPGDAHAHGLGFRSQQEMHAITFKKTGGVQCRTTYNATLN